MYFSPTGTTKKVVRTFGEELAKNIGCNDIEEIDFTLKKNREKEYVFSENDMVVLGVPVYAGRVPNVLKEFLLSIKGKGALGVAFTLFGNRSFDDALVELRDIMKEDGFKVIGAGGFVGEHSFSLILGKGRPLPKDFEDINEFALRVANKIEEGSLGENFFVQGEVPYRPYYTPRNMQGEPVNILKVKPKTSDICTDCKLCVELCPMESILMEDPSDIPGICIKCGACVKFCPVGAKYYDDEGFLGHKEQIETNFLEPKENKWFL
jgi:ferredoxin/flavodoxin